MSELETLFRDLIASEGPISLERYMALANGHPTLGYYSSRDPFGVSGDFTTAPEISQMFGELIGLWAAEGWRTCGSPSPVHLVELGPGRGTMMRDVLRAARVATDFAAAVQVHLVEASTVLTARQRETLFDCGHDVTWHTMLDTLPEGPAIILANEFFDALPVRHYVKSAEGWRERLIGMSDDDALVWGLAKQTEDGLTAVADNGAILEVGAIAAQMVDALAARIVRHGGLLLAIDYGHDATSLGETLQAVRKHRHVDPLKHPGEADLTVHVDFAALARAAKAAGAGFQGPVTQKFFLEQLGIRARAGVLSKRAGLADVQTIATALNRLTSDATPTDMGQLFKVLCVTKTGTPELAGFVAHVP